MSLPVDIREEQLVASAGGPLNFIFGSFGGGASADGDIALVWIWSLTDISGEFLLDGQVPAQVVQRSLPFSVTAGAVSISGRVWVIGLSAASALLTFAPSGPGAFLADLLRIRAEARIPSTYLLSSINSGAGQLFHSPAQTFLGDGMSLIWIWSDGGDPTGPPIGYTLLGSTFQFGATYAGAFAGKAAGLIPSADWLDHPAVLQGTGFGLQFLRRELVVDAGRAYTASGAGIFTPHAGAFPLYSSPVGETVYAYPPDPTKVADPQPPFVRVPGSPYRPA
jgi:hypothetical protein